MPDIVVAEFMDEAAVREGFAGLDVLYDPTLVDRPADLARAVADARALIVRNRTQVRGALLEAAPRLRVIGRLGVGLDNIDLEACRARGIAVYPATGANDVSVAEYVITAALVLLRRAWFATDRVARGEWPRNALMGREASEKTLGLVGFGSIAREVALRAKVLGMSVIAHDPFVEAANPVWGHYGVKPASLEGLLAACHVVSLHVPLTDRTRNLIDQGRWPRCATMRSSSMPRAAAWWTRRLWSPRSASAASPAPRSTSSRPSRSRARRRRCSRAART